MTEADKKRPITDEQIADAANALFQTEKGYIRRTIDQKGIIAIATLHVAGREAVRKVCSSNLGCLNAQFWASDEEVKQARKLTANYVKMGFVSATVFFQNFGLGNHASYLAQDQYNLFPYLNQPAKERLFSYVGEVVSDEIFRLHPNIYVAINKLNPDDPKKPL